MTQFTQDQICHVDKVLVGTVTSRFRLGGLDQPIEAFKNAITNLSLKPADYAIPTVHDSVGHLEKPSHFFQLVIFYHIQLKWEGFSRCPDMIPSHHHSNQRQKASATISGELDGALGSP